MANLFDRSPRDRLIAASLAPFGLASQVVPALTEHPDALESPPGLTVAQQRRWARLLIDDALSPKLEAELRLSEGLGAWILTPLDAGWPAWLPRRGVLRGRGPLPGASGLAIVGARAADRYGLDVARRVAASAVEAGLAVISGGALGVDAAAHQGALDAGGQTVVVLGSGMAHWTPASHRWLFEGVLQAGGAVISPWPHDARPRAWTYPHRNAWIAGLARATVVIQARVRSGTLYTARASTELGRPVYAVPGPMDSPLHGGCHHLVECGARLLLQPGGWRGAEGGQSAQPAEPEPVQKMVEPEGFSTAARALWRAASVEPTELSVLAEAAELLVPEAISVATLLEIEGWLRAAPGGRFARSRPRSPVVGH